MKTRPQKMLIINPKLFIRKYGPAAAQTSPALICHIMNMSRDSSVSLSVQPTQPLYGLRARHTTKEITLLRRIYSNDSAIGLHHVPKDI